jgi:hypothetical protein
MEEMLDFTVLAAVTVKNAVFWIVTLYSGLKVY